MGILNKFFLDRKSAAVVVIDIQEKLCKAMDGGILEKIVANTTILLEAAKELQLPVLVTEQYTRGLGETLPVLKEKLTAPAMEKMTFSCCGDPLFLKQLRQQNCKQVLIVGMETHVCVLQTVLELLDKGYAVHVVSDAVMSRKKENWQVGLQMAAAAGAVITSTEVAMFQLLKAAGTEEFKKLSKLLK